MSMTREEAIEVLENGGWWDLLIPVTTIEGKIEDDKLHEALDLALSALRPVSREQVEQVFPGCEMCREKKKVKSDNFCGAATMKIVGDSIDLCGDEKKIKFFGHIYAPSFSVKFCPFCSRPLTDEAVEMVTERLEALKDGNVE